MKVCKIWDSDYPWDVRVEKICKTLIGANHEVHLVCRNKKRQQTYDLVDGMHVHRLPCFKNKKINEMLSFPAFFNPLWILKIWKIIKTKRIEIILVRDLPLALTAVLLGKMANIPVILDMAENYPQMIKDLWEEKNFKLRNIFIRNPYLVKLVELIAIRHVDHILVVVAESAERLEELGVNMNKITIITNAPQGDRAVQHDKKTYPGSLAKLKDDFIIVYLGLLEQLRGIETAIKAMQIVKEKIKNCRFVIIGNGKDEHKFKELVRNLNLQENVLFEGYVKYELALQYICSSDVGIVPHHATPSCNTTIPNKLFDYMSMGKPVIVSDTVTTKRVITKEKCGLVFKDRDPDSLASAIIQLYSNRDLQKEFGRRGRIAVAMEYNWERESIKLLRLFNGVKTS